MNDKKVEVELPEYHKSDFKQLKWNDYGKLLEGLLKKIKNYVEKNKIHIDAIVPILRGGMVPSLYLGHKLHILKYMPVQYKYFFEGKDIKIKKLFDYPKLKLELSKNPTFLLVEGNHCFGETAKKAAKDLMKSYPNCRIIYAADLMDYSYQNVVPAETEFYGRLTNETRGVSKEEEKKLNLTHGLNLYPWEDLDEEWTTVSGRQFKYKDLK